MNVSQFLKCVQLIPNCDADFSNDVKVQSLNFQISSYGAHKLRKTKRLHGTKFCPKKLVPLETRTLCSLFDALEIHTPKVFKMYTANRFISQRVTGFCLKHLKNKSSMILKNLEQICLRKRLQFHIYSSVQNTRIST